MLSCSYTAATLSEYYKIVADIAGRENIPAGCPLWFRGHPYTHYKLLPGIMRKADDQDALNRAGTYGTKNLREDYRMQNYKARVFHLISSKPSMRLEWQALYQHNFGKTRLLDWSESARTALSFSLEAFIDPREREDLECLRHSITPTVWVLNPRKLNEKVYDYFESSKQGLDNLELIEKALKSIRLERIGDRLRSELKRGRKSYFSIDESNQSDIGVDGIINLSVIDMLRNDIGSSLKEMLKNYEFNPFFYLCLRYYNDALPVEIKGMCEFLPPLAVLHQYQGERIRAQRGVFTIFPNYYLAPGMQRLKKAGYDCRILENQPSIKDCLYEIRIMDPVGVAKELLFSGEPGRNYIRKMNVT